MTEIYPAQIPAKIQGVLDTVAKKLGGILVKTTPEGLDAYKFTTRYYSFIWNFVEKSIWFQTAKRSLKDIVNQVTLHDINRFKETDLKCTFFSEKVIEKEPIFQKLHLFKDGSFHFIGNSADAISEPEELKLIEK